MTQPMHPQLPAVELNAANLEGAQVYGPAEAEHNIGQISHVQGTGPNTRVVVDVGGFLGIGAKHVALDLAQLDFRRDDSGTVYARTALSKDELEDLPEHQQ